MVNITKQELANIAKKVKEHVEKNHSIPSEVDGVRHGEYTYLFCKIIVANGLKDIQRKSVGTAPNPTGDTIHDNKIWRTDYLDMCRRLIKFVDENGKLPNYITWKNVKVHTHLYEYAFSKIINYMAVNSQEPNYVTVDSSIFNKTPTPTTTKYGHATKSGCDNRGQNNGVNCGPHSVQEIVRNLTGVVIPQSTLASWAGTGSGGSSHSGLETAIAMAAKKTGVKLSSKWYNFSDLGWDGINKILKSNNQDCIVHSLYRSTWGHYEVINSISGNTVNVQNSLGSTCANGCYCGYVESRASSTFRSYINGISQKSILVVTRG